MHGWRGERPAGSGQRAGHRSVAPIDFNVVHVDRTYVGIGQI